MSRKATDWAWGVNVKPATLKLILLSMADRADEYHCCYPSIARLVKDTSLNKKTIQSGIAKLAEIGLIHDTGGRKGPTKRVRIFRLAMAVNDENLNVPEIGNVPKNGTLNVPDIGTLNVPEIGIQNQSIEPVNRTSNASGDASLKSSSAVSEKKTRKTTNEEFINTLLDAGVKEEIASEYLSLRKSKRLPLTTGVINLLMQEVSKADCNLNQALETCVLRGWGGFKASWLSKEEATTNQSMSDIQDELMRGAI